MNKQLLRFTIFLLICLILPLSATAQVVEIPDLILRGLIETELGKSSGDTITAPEMTTLKSLHMRGSKIGDLTGLEFATNLERLHIAHGFIRDLSPLVGLTRLYILYLGANSISDLSPLTGLTNLIDLSIYDNEISDISLLAGLIKLESLNIGSNSIPDVSPLAGLTNLEYLKLGANPISDLSPLAGLTKLKTLHLRDTSISDLSSLAGLTNLTELTLYTNPISDISPLAGLINLQSLNLGGSPVSDISALAGLTKLQVLQLGHNYQLSDISPLTGLTNLRFLDLQYNSVKDLSPIVANTGLADGDTIGVLANPLSDISINTHIPALRSRGVTVHNTKLFFPTINPVSVGDTFTLSLVVDDVVNLAGWQLDIAFNPSVLKAVSVAEGDFLSRGGGSTFFAGGNINNTTGKITDVSAAFIGTGGISGTGALLDITFEAKAYGEGRLRLENVRLGDPNGDSIPHEIVINPFTFKPRHDVNGDGNVNIFDLILIAQNFGKANPQADANGDGSVNIFDLIVVAQHLGESTTGDAPAIRWNADLHSLHSETIQNWIDLAYTADDGSKAFRQGIANLKRLLAAMRPDTTALLANYPNPFNPETWIPYHLAHDTDVTLTIYDTKGAMVRRLDLGHQQTGYYTDRTKAAYWDGRNNLGESVGSGVYFYQLQTEDFSAIRKMVILK